MNPELWASLSAVRPLLVLSGWACALLLVDLFIPKDRKGVTAALTALGLLLALGLVLAGAPASPQPAFGGMLKLDGFSNFLSVLLLLSGLASVVLAYDYLKRAGIERGEYYVLLLFSLVGMILMGMAVDLMLVFLALELLSIPLYVLAGIAVPQLNSAEAAIKYFLLGAFASSFFVYGIALVYGAAGTTVLEQIVVKVGSGQYMASLLTLGAALILVGLGFKVATVPFHMWTPDVYHGAPTSVTAFMAVGAKTAGFAALARIFMLAFPILSADLVPVLWGLSAVTMIFGNVVAIAQTQVKRLLAYSSIAQAGYLLLAFVPLGQQKVFSASIPALLFYLVAYAFSNFAAWAVVIALEHGRLDGEEVRGLELKEYAGLGRKSPALAAALAVAMFSFTGVPPTLGFMGKFFLFRTLIEGGFIGLALIGVFTSLVSAFYYLRLVVIMYMQEGDPLVRREPWLYLVACGAAAGVVGLGIFSAPLLGWALQGW